MNSASLKAKSRSHDISLILKPLWGVIRREKALQGMLLGALKRARLVAASATIESINLSRSGRTDRGVSGLGQV